MTQIIYHNRVYPDNAFEERRFLDVVIHQSRVPPLADYLRQFANEVVSILVAKEGGGKTFNVIVVLYQESSSHVLKRYVMDLSQFVGGMANRISSLDFLHKPSELYLARINLPNFDWNSIYSSLRSLLFLHLQELKRTEEHCDKGLFYKLLLNTDLLVDLSGDNGQWINLLSDLDTRKTKFVPIGEISTGFLCFDLHNEYVL